MYIANAEMLRWAPNTTYIPLARIGVLHWGNSNFMFRIGGNANFSVFRDTNMLVYPMQNCGVGGINQRKDPT